MTETPGGPIQLGVTGPSHGEATEPARLWEADITPGVTATIHTHDVAAAG